MFERVSMLLSMCQSTYSWPGLVKSCHSIIEPLPLLANEILDEEGGRRGREREGGGGGGEEGERERGGGGGGGREREENRTVREESEMLTPYPPITCTGAHLLWHNHILKEHSSRTGGSLAHVPLLKWMRANTHNPQWLVTHYL